MGHSIEYLVEGRKFGFDYQELKEKYMEFISMSDQDFLKNLVDAAHFASVICFIKNIPSYLCLSDTGVVHEIIHLMKENGTTTPLSEIRELFEQQLKLS